MRSVSSAQAAATAKAEAASAAGPPIIELDALSVMYGARLALDNVSVRVGGGAVGLLGPNGAGKSTLIKTLLGLLHASTGSGRVLGQPIGARDGRLRRRIGYMPERDAAFPGLTGFQSAWYAGRLAGMPDADARRRAHEVLLFAGLEEARYRDVATYSTGMKQRVKLAQALVHDPDLVFLDEPTNGLDPEGRLEMLDLIRLLAREKGIHVVLSSHLLRDVEEVCNSVVVLQGGKIVRHETLSALAHSSPDAYSVRIGGDPAAFRVACEAAGLPVLAEKERDFELRVPPAGGTAAVFGAALAAGTVVRMLRPSRVSLEDALIDVLGGVR
ncbi:MAG TPA: ABC transporter ATP-binding protein [Planctomycetota bacterium]|nr:ABC transporter ATP-binding protein [Planctomycetota bacterium]